jgi:hypothetical protein
MPAAPRKRPAASVRRVRLTAPPPMTEAEEARLRAIAALTSEPEVDDDDSPDVGRPRPGLAMKHDPRLADLIPVDPAMVAWFDRHGGIRAMHRALRAWMREHQHA